MYCIVEALLFFCLAFEKLYLAMSVFGTKLVI